MACDWSVSLILGCDWSVTGAGVMAPGLRLFTGPSERDLRVTASRDTRDRGCNTGQVHNAV